MQQIMTTRGVSSHISVKIKSGLLKSDALSPVIRMAYYQTKKYRRPTLTSSTHDRRDRCRRTYPRHLSSLIRIPPNFSLYMWVNYMDRPGPQWCTVHPKYKYRDWQPIISPENHFKSKPQTNPKDVILNSNSRSIYDFSTGRYPTAQPYNPKECPRKGLPRPSRLLQLRLRNRLLPPIRYRLLRKHNQLHQLAHEQALNHPYRRHKW